MIVEVGFEPTKQTQQILSLPPLTTRALNYSREPQFPAPLPSIIRAKDFNLQKMEVWFHLSKRWRIPVRGIEPLTL